MKNYVKSAQYFVLPPCELLIEMEIVVQDTQYRCMIQDNENWIYDELEGRVKYAYPIKNEKSLYRVTEDIIDLKTGEKRSLLSIEKEMVLDFLFEHCGNEMTSVRKQEEARMIYLLGMDEKEFDSLSEKELELLSKPYEYSQKN